MKRDAQSRARHRQTTAEVDADGNEISRHIEKRCRQQIAGAIDHAEQPDLVGHNQAARPIVRLSKVERRRETLGDALKRDGGRRSRHGRRHWTTRQCDEEERRS
jgi:hypothetical protein